ncbi:MAG: hypothetical protein ACTHMS_17810 [Jatrophihabitans sp.]|uniref:hypothetical protein n=1 Tax=Jatrophihabitans sp. TaxID=1932789 RepID=UPI003F7EEF9F
MSTVVRAQFYDHLAASEPDVLRVGEAADVARADGRYDLIAVPAPAFTAQDEQEVTTVLQAARDRLKPGGRLAFDYPNPRHGHSALPTAECLDRLIVTAGLVVHERYGDFARAPFQSSSPELITVAAVG